MPFHLALAAMMAKTELAIRFCVSRDSVGRNAGRSGAPLGALLCCIHCESVNGAL
jgi:hypothetical protein